MSDIAIRIENLGKQYRLGELHRGGYTTLRESIQAAVSAPWRRLFGRNGSVQESPTSSAEEEKDTIWALKDVSFDVPRGTVLGIIGRNGAGKSTLLKILSRITEPTTGRVEIHGRVGSLLEVGTGFHPELTGRENIFVNGSILGMTRREIKAKFDEIVAFAGIEKFLDTPVKRYSSGMSVRLAFAVAAHLDPEILVIDEVLAVGDAEFQKRCLGKMGEVAGRGRTVLFVSHNMAAVDALCNRALVLDGGDLLHSGEVEQCIARYLSVASPATFEWDLRDFPGRPSGISDRILQGLRICNAKGETLESLAVGDDVTFEILTESEGVIQDAAFGMSLYDSVGRRVTTLHTRYQESQRISLRGVQRVCCHVDNLRLVPDVYSITVGALCGRDVIDRIDSGLSFEITARDVYGTGRVPVVKNGPYVADAVWSTSDAEGSSAASRALA